MSNSTTLWIVAHQPPLSNGVSRQEYWGGLSCPPLGALPNPGSKPTPLSLLHWQVWQVSSLPLLLLLLLSRFSRVRLCAAPKTAAHQAPRPWESPGKNTGVGCHFLSQRMKVKSESEITQLCPTLRDPMDCSLQGSSVHGISQVRVLECGAVAFSIFTASTNQSKCLVSKNSM